MAKRSKFGVFFYFFIWAVIENSFNRQRKEREATKLALIIFISEAIAGRRFKADKPPDRVRPKRFRKQSMKTSYCPKG